MPIVNYINGLNKQFKTGIAKEHAYRGELQILLEKLMPGAVVTNEPAKIKCGAPDYAVTRKGIPFGYVEAKDIDKNLKDGIFNEQFSRYREGLNNLIITNYLEFQLYRDSELISTAIIGHIENNKITQIPNNFEAFKQIIGSFISYDGQTIRSALKLAKVMAGKAKLLANIIREALDSDDDSYENKSLHGQLEGFKKFLIHNITAKEFADIYSQTIVYGMFAARVNNTSNDKFSRTVACECIPKTNPFLRQLFGYIAGPGIDDRIKWIVDDLAEVFVVIDLKDILEDFGKASRTQDPTIHFYETFLSEYDPALRKSRGVWYTPQPVVNFIVGAVDDILQNEFGLSDGLADTSKIKIPNTQYIPSKRKNINKYTAKELTVHRVQLLDPATGTGTFLAEVIRQIHGKFTSKQGMWQSYVEDHLLPRIHGFELLMASYAMAHLKLNLMLKETGFTATTNKRLKVFLTNSLEEPHPDTGTIFTAWLSNEATEAGEVKRDMPVMVTLGNPPYSGESANKGKWIMEQIDVYKREPSGDSLRERNSKWLNDDYVKFIRYAELFIEKNCNGILAFINNHSFLDNPTFRGMRWHLLNTFDKIYIIDLHGNSKRREVPPDGTKDENVFDIQQGVSINIFVKNTAKTNKQLADVYHYDLYGTREYKYAYLIDKKLEHIAFTKVRSEPPFYFFVPKDFSMSKAYNSGFSIHELFQKNSIGIVTARDELTIQDNPSLVSEVINDFAKLDVEIARNKYNLGKDVQDWSVKKAQLDLLETKLNDEKIIPINYRPFDVKYTYYTGNSRGFHCRPRSDVMKHLATNDNCAVITCRQSISDMWNHVGITKKIVDDSYISNKTKERGYVFPLYQYDDLFASRQPNFNDKVIKRFAQDIKLNFVPEKTDEVGTFAPIDVLDYIYAVLHSPTYRETYKEFLKIDFPKISYPGNQDNFWRLVGFGAQLRLVHLLESEDLNTLPIGYPVSGDNVVSIPTFSEDRVFINSEQYFDNVPEITWDFFIGGYQPAQKWLKDRKGKSLSYEDIVHYQKILNALYLTNSLMQETDK